MLNRRDLLLGASSAAAILKASPALAARFPHGLTTTAAPAGSFSQRSIINMDFLYNNQIMFIDHLRCAAYSMTPSPGNWGVGQTVYNSAVLDANGWPTSVSGGHIQFGMSLPASANFAGPYIIDGSGVGSFNLNSIPTGIDTWTVNSKSANVTIDGDGAYTVTSDTGSGVGFFINVTYTGPGTFALNNSGQILLSITATNATQHLGYGGLTGRPALRFYRSADATDLAAGKIFRAPFKQLLVDNNPSAIRFMNWIGGNFEGDNTARWEQRARPDMATRVNMYSSPPYGAATGSTTNDMTLASATGMPVAHTHGEVVNFRSDFTNLRSPNAFLQPTAMSLHNPGVCTLTAHGFATGDKVLWNIASGMVELNFCVTTITVVDADNFSIGVDTTGLTTWVTSGQNVVAPMATLNVGARGAVPVFDPNGVWSTLQFGANYTAGNYYAVSFNKYLGYKTSPSGSTIMGVWQGVTRGSNSFVGGVPVEFCVALVNEVNAMYTTQAPTHMWLNMPSVGMLSVDPDYLSTSNWVTNTLAAVLNGGTYSGTTYAGLASNLNCFLEHSNETWNQSGGFYQTTWMGRAGQIRNGSRPDVFSTFSTLRSAVMVQDTKAAFPNNTSPGNRIKYVLGGWSSQSESNGIIYERVNGNQLIALDPWNTWGNVWKGTAHISGTTLTIDSTTSGAIQIGQKLFGTGIGTGDIQNPVVTITAGSGSSWTIDVNKGTIATEAMQAALAPMSIHDALCAAIYVSESLSWDTTNLDTMAAAWVANGSPASDPNIDAWLADIISNSSGSAQAVSFHKTGIDNFSTMLTPYPGTVFIGYEGQWDSPVEPGFSLAGVNGAPVITQAESNFLIACKHSNTWKNAWLGLLDYYGTKSNAAMPGQFTMAGNRWGYINPYSGQGTYSGTNETGAFDQVWLAMGARNRALTV